MEFLDGWRAELERTTNRYQPLRHYEVGGSPSQDHRIKVRMAQNIDAFAAAAQKVRPVQQQVDGT
jgi:hypothetical protein